MTPYTTKKIERNTDTHRNHRNLRNYHLRNKQNIEQKCREAKERKRKGKEKERKKKIKRKEKKRKEKEKEKERKGKEKERKGKGSQGGEGEKEENSIQRAQVWSASITTRWQLVVIKQGYLV